MENMEAKGLWSFSVGLASEVEARRKQDCHDPTATIGVPPQL